MPMVSISFSFGPWCIIWIHKVHASEDLFTWHQALKIPLVTSCNFQPLTIFCNSASFQELIRSQDSSPECVKRKSMFSTPSSCLTRLPFYLFGFDSGRTQQYNTMQWIIWFDFYYELGQPREPLKCWVWAIMLTSNFQKRIHFILKALDELSFTKRTCYWTCLKLLMASCWQ
jgi:hypothetical protein